MIPRRSLRGHLSIPVALNIQFLYLLVVSPRGLVQLPYAARPVTVAASRAAEKCASSVALGIPAALPQVISIIVSR